MKNILLYKTTQDFVNAHGVNPGEDIEEPVPGVSYTLDVEITDYNPVEQPSPDPGPGPQPDPDPQPDPQPTGPYLYIAESAEDAVSSAYTGNTEVSEEGGSGEFVVVTNYTSEEIATLTISADTDFTRVRSGSVMDYNTYRSFDIESSLGSNTNKKWSRTIYVLSGATILGEITVYQDYTTWDAYGYWDDSNHGAITITWYPSSAGGTKIAHAICRKNGDEPVAGTAYVEAGSSDWLSITPYRIPGASDFDEADAFDFTVTGNSNSTGQERTGYIWFTNEGDSSYLRVIQSA
jgi:hypothetical protein